MYMYTSGYRTHDAEVGVRCDLGGSTHATTGCLPPMSATALILHLVI